MAESSPVDAVLEYLRRNKFTKAEAALRTELGNRPDLNGILQKLTLDDKGTGNKSNVEANGRIIAEGDQNRDILPSSASETSKELIVKEVECGTSDKNFTFSKSSDDAVPDSCSWKCTTSNGPIAFNQNEENNFLGFQVSGKAKLISAETPGSGQVNLKSDAIISGEKKTNWLGTVSNASMELKFDKEVDLQKKQSSMCSKDERWKDCSVKTVFPFPRGDTCTSYDNSAAVGDKREGKKKAEFNDIKAAIKEQVDEVGRSLLFGKTQAGEPQAFGALEFHLASENQKEELPRLPPVRLKSEDKSFNIHWEEKYERDGPGPMILNAADNSYPIGSFLDVPIGQEIIASGKRLGGGSWLSVSQGIAEDTSDLVSGFATIGDGLSESIDYPNEYWDSDEYEDDDDAGYMRQPIEDETWFLAHEIDYPSDNDKGTAQGSVPERGPSKNDDDDQSFAEEDSYLSGEQFLQLKTIDTIVPSYDPSPVHEVYGRKNENDLMMEQYDGQLMDEEELSLMRAEPVWQGFVTQSNELVMLGDGKNTAECERPHPDEVCTDDNQHGSVRSIGVGINSDAADIGSEFRESLVGGSSDGDIEYFHDRDFDKTVKRDGKRTKRQNSDKYVMSNEMGGLYNTTHVIKSRVDGGFSFPPPRDGRLAQTSSNKSLWSNQANTGFSEEADDCGVSNDDMLANWRRKSSESSPVKSLRDEDNANSSTSSLSNYGYNDREHVKKEGDVKTGGLREEDPGASLEDEEAAAVQEQVKQIKAQEDEFETFDLKIVHRKNRTGFEEDKNFHVVLNSVIAGRYHVTEYLGSAAFSKAIQAHDLHTGMDVCMKIIKNNKDFFDQSLDEIKLLKYVNKHDPADKYHILRLYDYFYYREHLLIVCELLKANLYEFHKFNRESGGEVYFTMPRLQSITIQCLEALQFLHSLGLIHCDLKPENILVKSYSRCEVKVIDLGSSCFETDHLCSYVQSRSYRAPEVILGLPYDKKIDIWSLGCILAELCTGNVLFQNDSPATLLARVIGIIGTIELDMLSKGKDTYKYFTKNHMLYERNQDSNRLEYLIPKKSSLRHRLPMGDQGFIDFVAYLLQINPKKRPSASEALKHPWLQYPYEPISS
ncbi:Protein kinase superfamily protein [Striga hermonthica]|uniref:Protein kinase superfamily protein n=1 Tax=Striga hermonthica TaxID=68872 RepID=A0A9N7R932_STRHE|nr:Protein kinase superfamily protein [Striga hermonthica]